MTRERRRRLRVPVRLQAEVWVEGAPVPVESLNLSLKGLLCTSAPGFSPGLPCQVRLHLGAEVSLTIKGVIVRAQGQEAAIDFDSMDEESSRHLRRLVEYNAPGAAQVLSEMLAPAFPLQWQPRAGRVPSRHAAFPWRRSGQKG